MDHRSKIHISGARYSSGKISTWMNNNPEIQGIVRRVPSPCCYTTLDFCDHLRYVLTHYRVLHEFFGQLRWRRLRWKTRIKKMEAYDILADQLTAGAASTVIAYGGGQFSHASRGSTPTPNKHLFVELKKRCRVRLTPEFRTSQVCSLCEGYLDDTRFYSLKKCNDICLTLWNRDVNAARNIRHVFVYRNRNGGGRPYPFAGEQ
jgi:Putative transposase DNA-binding domain